MPQCASRCLSYSSGVFFASRGGRIWLLCGSRKWLDSGYSSTSSLHRWGRTTSRSKTDSVPFNRSLPVNLFSHNVGNVGTYLSVSVLCGAVAERWSISDGTRCLLQGTVDQCSLYLLLIALSTGICRRGILRQLILLHVPHSRGAIRGRLGPLALSYTRRCEPTANCVDALFYCSGVFLPSQLWGIFRNHL